MAELALLIVTILWGTTFYLVKQVLFSTSAAIFLAMRFAVALLALGLLTLALRGREHLDAEPIRRHGFLLGMAMFLGYALQTEGLRFTTPARSGFITGFAVLLVPVISRGIFHRVVLLRAWLGVVMALVGLLLLTRPFGGMIPKAVLLGDALTVGCAIAFAFQIVMTAEWSAFHPLAKLTVWQIGVTFLGSVLIVPFEPYRIARPTDLIWPVLFTGLVLTALAFFVQNWAQRHTTAVRAALIFALEPVAAALFSHFYGGEPLLIADWIGGLAIVLGVVIAATRVS